MTASTSSLPSLSLPDGKIKVEFAWHVDRFAHTFVFPDGSRVASVEGDGSDAWPPSPPLQQLSPEQVNGADVILGVGAAGSGHWSISVEVVLNSAGFYAFKFDFACRSKTDFGYLGSSYEKSDLLNLQPNSNANLSHTPTITEIRPREAAAGQTSRWTYLVSENR